MKKILGLGLVFSVLLTCSVFASTANTIQSKKEVLPDKVNRTQETHRVVHGYAAIALGNFMSNDWDTIKVYSPLTAEEKAFLQGLNLGAGVHWYIDLTTQTVHSSPLNNYSELVSSSFSTDTGVTYKDGEIVRTTTSQTTLNYKDVNYQIVWDGYDSSPLVLDLDTNTSIDVAYGIWTKHAPKFFGNYAKFFDITGDGQDDYTEWVPANTKDALLVMPENGKVENALQLFGTAGGYNDGYEKLALVCDKDNNSWVEGSELEGLALWRDINSDGICDASEISNLSDYGITAISTKHSNYVSCYKKNDGSTSLSWDWWPVVSQVRKFKAN